MLGRFKSWMVENVPRSWVLPLTRLAAFGIQRDSLDDAAHEIFFANGFHLLRKHYYLPIPNRAEIEKTAVSDLVGVEMNDAYALKLLEHVYPPYATEFSSQFPLQRQGDSSGFYLLNGSYMAVDAHVYYAFIRHFKPRQIIEVGAGNSTLVAAAAIRRNREEMHEGTDLTAIDPFPAAVLQGLPELTRVL